MHPYFEENQITSRCVDARVLLIIDRAVSPLSDEAIKLGARGVVSTEVPSPILRKAVRIIAAGGLFIEPWLAREKSEAPYHHVSNPFDALSPREQSVHCRRITHQHKNRCQPSYPPDA